MKKKPTKQNIFEKTPSEENRQDTERAILESIFESVEKSPKHEIQKIDNGFELKPGDKIVKKDGEYIIQAIIHSNSGTKLPCVKGFIGTIFHLECISNDPPSAKFFSYKKGKRLVLKEEISPYRLAHELAKEIESFKGSQESEWFLKNTVSLKELPLKRRHKTVFEKWFDDKKTWYGLNQARKELDQSLKGFLLTSTKEITQKPISDRMLWFYVARILVATGIETDRVDNVERNLQAKYRYQKKEKYPFDLADHCYI